MAGARMKELWIMQRSPPAPRAALRQRQVCNSSCDIHALPTVGDPQASV